MSGRWKHCLDRQSICHLIDMKGNSVLQYYLFFCGKFRAENFGLKNFRCFGRQFGNENLGQELEICKWFLVQLLSFVVQERRHSSIVWAWEVKCDLQYASAAERCAIVFCNMPQLPHAKTSSHLQDRQKSRDRFPHANYNTVHCWHAYKRYQAIQLPFERCLRVKRRKLSVALLT